jgi:nicotinate-nucleotide adenylyltransferase
MKIGLYFGSFNPVHIGHCIIASHVLNNSPLEQIWLVVSPQNPFKESRSLLNEYHRLHLVQKALGEEVNLKASDVEFHLPKPSFTIDTLVSLQEKYPQHNFSVVMGSDSYQNLPKWKNGEIIIRDYDLYIYVRTGFPITQAQNPRLNLLDAPLLEISSTRIRGYIRERKSIRFLVPDAVKTEIEQNGYYR